MAIKLIGEKYCPVENDNIREFLCDTVVDVTNLQSQYPNCCPGSTAVVIQTGDVYIANTSRVWTKFGG